MNLVFTYPAGFKGISRKSRAVEDARQELRDAATLRLARIANGKEPGHAKGGRCAGK